MTIPLFLVAELAASTGLISIATEACLDLDEDSFNIEAALLFSSLPISSSKDHNGDCTISAVNGGSIATFRSDKIIWDFRDLSILEIQLPSGVQVSTVKQLATNTGSTYNPYVFGNATIEWKYSEHNIKILFISSPEYPSIGNLTTLSFRVQNLKTGSYLKNETATLTVLNNLTANINNVTKKEQPITSLQYSRI